MESEMPYAPVAVAALALLVALFLAFTPPSSPAYLLPKIDRKKLVFEREPKREGKEIEEDDDVDKAHEPTAENETPAFLLVPPSLAAKRDDEYRA
jgi:hypothetical protein